MHLFLMRFRLLLLDLTRLHLVKTPWFAVCLHWLNKPDPESHLHDHPVSFLSIILKGGYTEFRGTPFPDSTKIMAETRVHRWYNYIYASRYDVHTIKSVKPNTLTLCFMGPKVREWGFHTPDGWIYWKDYYKEKRDGKN